MQQRARDFEPDEDRFVKELGAALGEIWAGCPPPEMLSAAREGVLPEQVESRVAAHAAACPSCRMLSGDLGAEELSRLTPPERKRIWSRVLVEAGIRRAAGWRWFLRPAPAAVIALAAAVGAWIYVSRPAPRTGSAPEPAAVRLSEALRLEKPAVKLPAAAALTWRSEEARTQEEFLKSFGSALAPYRAGDYREAASRLESLVQRYPGSAEAHFYLGICRLFLERNQEAAAALEQAKRLGEGDLAQDAAWYLSIAWLRAGSTEQGVSELRRLCGVEGEHQARACAALKELGR